MISSDPGGAVFFSCPGVVPVLVGPLQVLLTILPGLLLAMLGGIVALFKPSGMKNLVKLMWRQKLAVLVLALFAGGVAHRYLGGWSSAGGTPVTNRIQPGKQLANSRLDHRRTCG